MRIENIEILLTKIEMKQGKNNNYLSINFITIPDGQNFEVIDKNIELIQKLQSMTKYKVNFNLSSSKYGLQLSIENVLEKLGGI